MKTTRPLVAVVALLVASATIPALAHHGWRWTSGENIALTGVIREASLGNPHGVLKVQAEDEMWTVEVGQPWRNERAGLTDAMLSPGVEATFHGEPSADAAEKRMKAERIEIDGEMHQLYPDRD